MWDVIVPEDKILVLEGEAEVEAFKAKLFKELGLEGVGEKLKDVVWSIAFQEMKSEKVEAQSSLYEIVELAEGKLRWGDKIRLAIKGTVRKLWRSASNAVRTFINKAKGPRQYTDDEINQYIRATNKDGQAAFDRVVAGRGRDRAGGFETGPRGLPTPTGFSKWREEEHPRGPDGKFVNKTVGKRQIGTTARRVGRGKARFTVQRSQYP